MATPKELEEVDRVAKKVSKNTRYPIRNFKQLADALGGEDAEVQYEGKGHKLGQAKKALPEGFFPVESEQDLIAKASFVRARLRPGAKDHTTAEERDKPGPDAGEPDDDVDKQPRKGGVAALQGKRKKD